jgi:hypothetical protein
MIRVMCKVIPIALMIPCGVTVWVCVVTRAFAYITSVPH